MQQLGSNSDGDDDICDGDGNGCSEEIFERMYEFAPPPRPEGPGDPLQGLQAYASTCKL